MRIPYTYILSSTDGHLYVGSKYSKDAHPNQLLRTYFTSSKHARPLILEDLSKWSVLRLQEGKDTDEVVQREMEWQLEFRHYKGMLNKSINRAEGKWVNHGPMSMETRLKMSTTKKGISPPRVTIEAARRANLNRKCPDHVKSILRDIKTGVPRTAEERKNISEAMIRNQSTVGSKNPNTTRWTLEDPSGKVINQSESMTGKEFIDSLGLSYQMLLKFRSKDLPFSGKWKGWRILFCSRPSGQHQRNAGLRKN